MSCSNPLYALRLGALNPKTGKERIKILPRIEGNDYFSLCKKHGSDNVIPLPCGKCSSCVEARSKSWALRCVCEASLHQNNMFITLTYNNKCCPKGLCKKDVQKYIKALRYRFPDNDIRYYLVGEYGPLTNRPHYHAIIFGLFPDDAKFSTMLMGNPYFTSKKVQDCWPFGFVSITECTYQSCAYVARYCQKKLKDPEKRQKEFSMMSLKPGIGAEFFELNREKIYKYDCIVGNFGRSLRQRPSRYFDKLFEKFDAQCFQVLKEQRISKANQAVISDMIDHGFKYYEHLLEYRAGIKDKKMSYLQRREL